MAKKSLSRAEYVLRGKHHQMTLLGDAPQRATMPTLWRCDVCGRELEKSVNAIMWHSPCICRTPLTLKPNDYSELANRLGIQWQNEYPHNNKVKVSWIGVHGESFKASYTELAYDFIPSRLKGYLE